MLAAEEKPEQYDDRDRHAQQPQQNSASHFSLSLMPLESVGPMRLFRCNEFSYCSQIAIAAGHQCPVLGMELHGSFGASASPFCNNSMECRSGERMNAIWPSRGGRLMVMPSFIKRSQVA